MILSWISYALLVSGLLALAAWMADRSLRLVGRPTRLVWLTALALGVLVPLGWYALRTWLPETELPSAGLGAIALPSLSSLWVAGSPTESTQVGVRLADLAFPLTWIGISLTALVVMALTQSRLRVERASWRSERVAGVPVLVSRGTGPATVGVLRPQVVLPEWALGLPRARQDMILKHELEHVRAHDGMIAIVGFTLAALVPWNPALWWMFGRLRLAQEMDCDQRLIASGVPVRGYLEVLLSAVGPAPRATLAAPGFSFPRNSLRRRVLQMTHRPGRVSTIRAMLLGTSAIGLGLLACDAPAPAELDDTPAPNAGVAPGTETDGTLHKLKEYRFGSDLDPSGASPEGDAEGTLNLKIESLGEAVPFGAAVKLRELKEARELDAELEAYEEQVKLRFGTGSPIEIHEGEQPNRVKLSILIIDGEEFAGPTTDLKAQIGTLEIETVEVVSGPRAVELYGPRAADGAIIVTTKRD
jgi:hypothetical protein